MATCFGYFALASRRRTLGSWRKQVMRSHRRSGRFVPRWSNICRRRQVLCWLWTVEIRRKLLSCSVVTWLESLSWLFRWAGDSDDASWFWLVSQPIRQLLAALLFPYIYLFLHAGCRFTGGINKTFQKENPFIGCARYYWRKKQAS